MWALLLMREHALPAIAAGRSDSGSALSWPIAASVHDREAWATRDCCGAPGRFILRGMPSPPHGRCNDADRLPGMQALTGKHASPAAAAEHLEKLFSEGGNGDSRRVTVLLVDEMDLLITKKQQV